MVIKLLLIIAAKLLTNLMVILFVNQLSPDMRNKSRPHPGYQPKSDIYMSYTILNRGCCYLATHLLS